LLFVLFVGCSVVPVLMTTICFAWLGYVTTRYIAICVHCHGVSRLPRVLLRLVVVSFAITVSVTLPFGCSLIPVVAVYVIGYVCCSVVVWLRFGCCC